MGKFEDLTGKTFNRLTVIKRAEVGKKEVYYLCKCTCGKEKIIRGKDLKYNKIKSCGCLNKEKTTERNTKHNLRHTRIYRIWLLMKNRCLNSKYYLFKNYGGRGITICNEWKNDFMSFYNWAMNNGYDEHLTIDRIDVNGNYEPFNCRWATKLQQQRNTTRLRKITYKNETHCISEWAEILGLEYNTLYYIFRRNNYSEDVLKRIIENV